MATIERLSAEDERTIVALLTAYATAADTRDAALLESCFTADVTADYHEPIGQFATRDVLVGGLMAMLGQCGPTLHFVANPVIRAQGGGAVSRCYTHAVVHIPGMDQPIRTAGIYDDELVRDAAGWRIARRVYTPVA